MLHKQVRDRDKAIRKMESLLRSLSRDPNSGVQFVEDSRYMAIFRERAFQVSRHPAFCSLLGARLARFLLGWLNTHECSKQPSLSTTC